jgi:competence protein ComEC
MRSLIREFVPRIDINDRHLPAFIFLWSFILGVFVSSFVFISPLISVSIFVFVSFLYLIIRLSVSNPDRIVLLLIVAMLAFSFGAFRYGVKDFHEINPLFEDAAGEEITIHGRVVNEPERKEDSIRAVVQTDGEKVLMSTSLFSNIEYGDEIVLRGKLEKPGIIESDSGRDFDYGKYLSKDDIYYTLNFADVEIVSKGHGNKIIFLLLRIKHSFTSKISKLLPEPEASLLSGLLISGKQALPESVLEEFRRAGVSHIVVLSGYNITIVAEFMQRMFGFLALRFSILSSVVGIVLFTLMTGATATVMRAAVMAIIVLFGRALGRGYSIGRSLLVAGFLMILENPKILVFDASFELSFLAVLALVYVSPLFERLFRRFSNKWGIKSILSVTLSAQLTVLPFLLYSMGNVSLVSPLSNMLILILVPATMFAGFIATLIGFINYYLALPFSYMAHLMLSYILAVAHVLGNLIFANIEINHFSAWLMIGFYVLIAALILKWNSRLQADS